MKLTVAGLGAKHVLDLEPEETIRNVKARLEALTSLSAAEMRLLVKGKAPEDATKLGGLGLSDGAKIMLMRSAAGAKTSGAKPAAASTPGVPAWLVVGAIVDYVDGKEDGRQAEIKAVHTDDPEGGLYCTISLDGAERQTPADRLRLRTSSAATVSAAAGTSAGEGASTVEAGEGPVTLTVSQGKRLITLRCEASTSVKSLKALLAPITGADAGTMKLLYKGREATDASTVDALGLAPAGGKLMLLFRARHHREAEGAAAVANCSEQLVSLRERVKRIRHKISKRLLTGGEALAELGGLDEELAGLAQDLKNAAPNESSEAASARAARIAECDALSVALGDARREEAQAELRAQTGRLD